MKVPNLTATLSIFLLVTAVFFSSCKKEEETIATITVVDADGAVVSGAAVQLIAIGSPDVETINELRFDENGVTNASGKVSFNFTEFYKEGQAGFAVLDIRASKGDLYGEGLIQIEEEETNEETVVIEEQ